jgi:hypothetical protein
VNVATGAVRTFSTTDPFDVLSFDGRTVYLYAPSEPQRAPGLWALDVTSGQIRNLFSDRVAVAVTKSTAWLEDVNVADSAPFITGPGTGEAPDELLSRSLVGAQETAVWFYRPGASVELAGFDIKGDPLVVVVRGDRQELWHVSSLSQASLLYSDQLSANLTGPPIADSYGLWIATNVGIYLYRIGHGLLKVSPTLGWLAGPCLQSP